MITKPTVFLTGAGASSEFGYPLGSQLLIDIQTEILNHSTQLGGINLSNFRWPVGVAEDFRLRLLRSVPRSIDSFIQLNPNFKELAQFCISFSLLNAEKETLVFSRSSNYLHFIWHEMINGVKNIDDFKMNKVSFVTFNYDRTIEFFFQNAIVNLFPNVTTEEAIAIIKSFPIIHIFGDLNPDETLNERSDKYFQYGRGVLPIGNNSVNKTFEISKNLSLLHDSEHHFDEAFSVMQTSEQIFIMGFGYEDSSFDKLRLKELNQGKYIMSSCIGLSKIIKDRVQNKMFGAKNKLHFEEHNSLVDLLKNRLG
jgi:hypothetical protein